jgi:hypothetical protein
MFKGGEDIMEKVISAIFDGIHVTPDETLHVPPNTRIKIVIDTEDRVEHNRDGTNQPLNLAEPADDNIDLSQQKTDVLLQLLESWVQEGDAEEQRETWEFLKQALDEDRFSDRRLFP